jgi:hypothetical protein
MWDVEGTTLKASTPNRPTMAVLNQADWNRIGDLAPYPHAASPTPKTAT